MWVRGLLDTGLGLPSQGDRCPFQCFLRVDTSAKFHSQYLWGPVLFQRRFYLFSVFLQGLCICLLIVCTIALDENSSLSRHTPIFRFFRFLRRGCQSCRVPHSRGPPGPGCSVTLAVRKTRWPLQERGGLWGDHAERSAEWSTGPAYSSLISLPLLTFLFLFSVLFARRVGLLYLSPPQCPHGPD